jgi:uncharacterized protein YndB with AHSA1/START domain
MALSSSAITVRATIQCPVIKVWDLWTNPMHILKWNAASDTWHTTYATNEVRAQGRFCFRMEAKNGSIGFDFTGTYTKVVGINISLTRWMMGVKQ